MADANWIPDDIERNHDIPFTEDGETGLKLDLYRMRRVHYDVPQPVVIWLHGGGWMSGDKERMVHRIFGLVHAGFIGASVSYRLSQEALFPANMSLQWRKA